MQLSNVAKSQELGSPGTNQLRSGQLKTEADFSASKSDFARRLELKQISRREDVRTPSKPSLKPEPNRKAVQERAKATPDSEGSRLKDDWAKPSDEAEALKKEISEKVGENQALLKSKEPEEEVSQAEAEELDRELLETLQALVSMMRELNSETEEASPDRKAEEALSKIGSLLDERGWLYPQEAGSTRQDSMKAEDAEKLLSEMKALLDRAALLEAESLEQAGKAQAKSKQDFSSLQELFSALKLYQAEFKSTEARTQTVEAQNTELDTTEEAAQVEDMGAKGAEVQTTESAQYREEKTNPAQKLAIEAEGETAEAIGAEHEPGAVGALVSEFLEAEKDFNLVQQTKLGQTMKTDVFEQVRSFILREGAGINERSEMVIRLKPEELGRLELKIELHNDEVRAKFNVASEQVKEALEANLEDLKMALKDKGFDVTNFAIDVRDGSKQGRSGEREQLRRPKSYYKVEAHEEEISLLYQKSLEATVAESTFEHLA